VSNVFTVLGVSGEDARNADLEVPPALPAVLVQVYQMLIYFVKVIPPVDELK